MPDTNEHAFTIIVIATSEKKVPAKKDELIGAIKIHALHEFGIPKEKASEFALARTPGDKDSILLDDKTAGSYELHEDSRLYLVKPHNDA